MKQMIVEMVDCDRPYLTMRADTFSLLLWSFEMVFFASSVIAVRFLFCCDGAQPCKESAAGGSAMMSSPQ